MNTFQTISMTMTTSQAVVFWILVFAFVVFSILAIVGFAIDKKLKVNEMQKKLNRLQKKNNELLAQTNTLRSLYREQSRINDEMRRRTK